MRQGEDNRTDGWLSLPGPSAVLHHGKVAGSLWTAATCCHSLGALVRHPNGVAAAVSAYQSPAGRRVTRNSAEGPSPRHSPQPCAFPQWFFLMPSLTRSSKSRLLPYPLSLSAAAHTLLMPFERWGSMSYPPSCPYSCRPAVSDSCLLKNRDQRRPLTYI